MLLHPLPNLSEQDILRLRVAKQVINLDLRLSMLDDRLKLLVCFLNSVQSSRLCDVFDSL